MLKCVIILSIICACWALPAVPQQQKAQPSSVVPIISEDIDVGPNGSYHYSYEAGNGIKIHEEGVPKQLDKDHVVESVSGEYSYPGPDNQVVSLKYVADETGFHPKSDSIPALPPAIVRLLEYLETHPDPQIHGEKIN